MGVKTYFHNLKDKLAYIFLVLALLQTCAYAYLDFVGYETYMKIIEVLTIPFIILYYIFRTEFLDISFIGILLLVFLGDYSNTFLTGYDDISIVLYGVSMIYYTYIIIKRIREFCLKAIISVLVPFLIVYIGVFVWFTMNAMEISNAIILYNTSLGVFSVFAFKGYVMQKSFNTRILFLAALNVCLLTILYGYVNFVEPNSFVSSFGLNIPFTLFHSLMAIYVVKTEAVMYRYKSILKADKKENISNNSV